MQRTSNGGSTWENSTISVPSYYPLLSYFSPSDLIFTDSQNGYIVGRAYRRYSAMYGVTTAVVLKTQDNGQTWTMAFDSAFDISPTAIAFRNSSQGLVVGGKGLLLNISTIGGISFQNPSNRTFLPLKSVAGSPSNVVAVGGRLRTTENGPHFNSKAVTMTKSESGNWAKAETGFGLSEIDGYPYANGNTLSQVKFKTSQFGWKVGYRTMSFTKDGGNTWQSLFGPVDPRTYSYIFERAHFKSDSAGFVLLKYYEGNPAELFSFSGASRTPIDIPYKGPSDPYNTGMLDLQFIDDDTGFITSYQRQTHQNYRWGYFVERAVGQGQHRPHPRLFRDGPNGLGDRAKRTGFKNYRRRYQLDRAACGYFN